MAFVKVANVDDIPNGRALLVEVDDLDVALCKFNDEIYAIANVCSHDDGPLGAGFLHGAEIECPRHGARFDVRSGAAKSLPAIAPIPTFSVKVVDNEVWVEPD